MDLDILYGEQEELQILEAKAKQDLWLLEFTLEHLDKRLRRLHKLIERKLKTERHDRRAQ